MFFKQYIILVCLQHFRDVRIKVDIDAVALPILTVYINNIT